MPRTPLAEIVDDHIRRNLSGDPTACRRELEGERKAIRKYAARELHELLQNAVDRARASVVFARHGDRLVVGNDGKAVSIRAQTGSEPSSDFHGLCSINLSRKAAWQAIGNKGVGFKSVFASARVVQVWSEHEDHGWWGFRLRRDFGPEHAHGSMAGPMRELCAAAGGAPSFYFPELLDEAPELVQLDWVRGHELKTLVVLEELLDPEELARRFETFAETSFRFVAARYPSKRNLRVHFLAGGEPRSRLIDLEESVLGWPPDSPRSFDSPELRDLAQEAELQFAWEPERPGDEPVTPHLRVAFDPDAKGGFYWCFLPTEEPCPFPVQLHGDFLLGDDRRSLQRGSAYNRHLLGLAPPLLTEAFLELLVERGDCWQVLRPEAPWSDPLVTAVSAWLFDEAHRFVDLAEEVFGVEGEPKPRSRSCFEGFWQAVQAWEWRMAEPYKRADSRVNRVERRILAPLRQRRVCCLPVRPVPMADGPFVGAPLPDQTTLFVREARASGAQGGAEPVPAFLSRRCGVQITWWMPSPASDHQYKKHLGWQTYRWREVGVQMRSHLVGDEKGRDPTRLEVLASWRRQTAGLQDEEGQELLSFLFSALGEGQIRLEDSPGARLRVWAASDGASFERASQLRDLALVPLPVVGGGWLPAMRCSTSRALAGVADGERWGVVDRERMPAGELQDRVLRVLGVWPSIPLVLDEGAADLAIRPSELDAERAGRLLQEVADHLDAYREAFPLGLAPALTRTPWFPVGDRQVAPSTLWRLRAGDTRDYGEVPVLAGSGLPDELLEAFGVYPIVQRRKVDRVRDHHLPLASAKAIRALRGLRQRYPHPDLAPRPGALRRVCARLAEIVRPDDVSDLPVLASCQEEGRLRWVSLPHDPAEWVVWRASREGERWRWRFPSLWFVDLEPDAELGRDTKLARFHPRVTAHARPADAALVEDPLTRGALQDAFPILAAVAELERYGPEGVFDLELALRRWNRLRVLRGPDVYLRIDPGRAVEPATEGESRLGDVYFGDSAAEGVDVLHDVPDQPTERLAWGLQHPSRYLPEFARWLAREVFQSPRAEGSFRTVLGLVAARNEGQRDARALLTQKLKELWGLVPDDVLDMRRRCSFMSSSERQALREALTAVLLRFGELEALDPLTEPLHPGCFRRGSVSDPELTGAEVQRALQEVAPASWAVHFETRSHNLARWDEEKPRLRKRVLLAEIEREGLEHWSPARVAELREAWRQCAPDEDWLGRVAPEVWEVVRSAFPRADPELRPSDERAERILLSRPWKAPERPRPGAGLRRRPVTRGAGSAAVQETAKRRSTEAGQRERGENAELATAGREAERLWPLLHGEGAEALWRVLEDERRARGDTRSFDREALEPADLARLLRVSGPGGRDCGFDVLSLDDAGRLRRIEVKSAQPATGAVAIHLSDNELRCALEDPSAYELLVYLGFEAAYDLSRELREILGDAELLDARERLLGVDSEHALEPDGYVLWFGSGG